MGDMQTHIDEHHGNVTEEQHIEAGEPVKGPIGNDHEEFLQLLFSLLDSNEIDPYLPNSFLNSGIYESLTEQTQDKVDLALNNIANQIRLIDNFRRNGGDTGSVHFHTMIEHLWQMKERIEIENDVFKF